MQTNHKSDLQGQSRIGRWLCVACCAAVLMSGTGSPQNSKLPTGSQPGEIPGFGQELPASVCEKQVKLQNEERQKRLVDDTQKLLTLATQLHDDVAKTDKNILSIDVVRRADEIEKLAHAVKDRMRG